MPPIRRRPTRMVLGKPSRARTLTKVAVGGVAAYVVIKVVVIVFAIAAMVAGLMLGVVLGGIALAALLMIARR